jgi:hypothetical protein
MVSSSAYRPRICPKLRPRAAMSRSTPAKATRPTEPSVESAGEAVSAAPSGHTCRGTQVRSGRRRTNAAQPRTERPFCIIAVDNRPTHGAQPPRAPWRTHPRNVDDRHGTVDRHAAGVGTPWMAANARCCGRDRTRTTRCCVQGLTLDPIRRIVKARAEPIRAPHRRSPGRPVEAPGTCPRRRPTDRSGRQRRSYREEGARASGATVEDTGRWPERAVRRPR